MEGWGFGLLNRKAHYFVDGRSLCKKWLYAGNLDMTINQKTHDKPGPDDCKECHRKLLKRHIKVYHANM